MKQVVKLYDKILLFKESKKEVIALLKPITKKFSDKSTMEQFEFVFYCDCCGKPTPTTIYKYDNRFENKKFLSESEQEARAIIYADEHSKAYERANNEARLEFNNCECCGIMLCDDCSFYNEDGGIVCKTCFEKEKSKKGGSNKK